MNRKSKIIVSVVGITIVLLALLGITYAYYLTRIEGNTNTNSISVTTADLKLVYGDGESELVTMSDIMPGTVIEKDFTVTNSGKSKVEGYLVVLENVNNTLNRKEDVVYTLNCKLSDATSCGTISETIYPSISTSVIFTNDIDVDVTHYYTLTVTYKNLEDVDQSEDMGSSFSGRVNIMDANTNPYKTGVASTDNTSLAYNIINNAMSTANGTIYSPTPLTTPAEEVSAYKYVGSNPTSYTTNTPTANYFFVYSDTYEINANGLFILTNPQVFQYATDLTSLKGKYITSYSGYNTESTANTNAVEGKTFSSIYYVGEETTTTTLSRGTVEKTRVSTESTLSTTNDIHGTSYYFRGGVQDNYVLFNNMCFRIVRIEGDGSVKLIFAGDVTSGVTNCNEVGTDTGYLKDSAGEITDVVYGYGISYECNEDRCFLDDWEDHFYYADYLNNSGGKQVNKSGLVEVLNTWFTDNFNTESLKEKVKTDKWCLGGNINFKYYGSDNFTGSDFAWNYAAGERYFAEQSTSLMCENEDYVESKYGTITSDETLLAGATYEVNELYYLYDNANNYDYWTISIARYYDDGVDTMGYVDYSFYIDNNTSGALDRTRIDDSASVRPMITLVPGTTIVPGGVGIKTNPYVIN